ncbi:heat shock 70 kDa protein 14-like [Sycon ciliatum]|uniref:heat shock 70 kDa protein 14-like n=1 Tax=Sycon ciliatum TaxID=27933 RepID=UPI0020AE9F20|eukprot:scpid41051/ scgid25135/ Heat shock 70 kDa protein 14
MASDRGIVLGISIGSTKGCVAIYKDDMPVVVANDAGDRVTPCATTLSGKENSLRVATRQEVVKGTGLIQGTLQLLCKTYEEVSKSSFVSRQICEVSEGPKGMPVFRISAEKSFTFTPRDAVTAVFAKLKESAKSAAGREDAKDCVIAVPVSFTVQQRRALQSAAEKAGLNVLRLLSEPACALLAYGIGQQSSPNAGNVVVYDIGATSVNVSVVSVMSGLYRVVAEHSNPSLGGRNFDTAVAKHFAFEFQRKWKMDMTDNKRSMAKLRAASELCRQSLSSLNTASATVESLYDGMDFQSNMSRSRFEGICGPLFQQCLEPVNQALAKAGLATTDISKVVITGGCARTPKLRQWLDSFFQGKAEVLSSISSEEVIATGASLQANLLASNVDRDLEECLEMQSEMPCLSCGLAIALGTADGGSAQLHPVFPVSTPIPARSKLTLNVKPDQTCAVVTVCEHSPASGEPARPVLRVVLKDLPATEQDKEIEISLSVAQSGVLKVSAKELSSKISAQVSTEPVQNGLSPGD